MAWDEVIDFWFDPVTKPGWFGGGEPFDRKVEARLGAHYAGARDGGTDGWAAEPLGLLALVILLDQVPRNIHRGTPAAFATDDKALALARLGVDRGFDAGFDKDQRLFLYLPFEHSEGLADQERSVALFCALGDADYLDYAIRHRDIVARFGRFPHRNIILGRQSTPEELVFLEQPGSSF
jgi:uncharacterized protein (DUF924 family)